MDICKRGNAVAGGGCLPWELHAKKAAAPRRGRPLLLGRVVSVFQPLGTGREGGAVEVVAGRVQATTTWAWCRGKLSPAK